MKKYSRLLVVILAVCLPAMSLSAAEENTEYSEFVKGLLNNKYMVENRRLLGLAEGAYADAKYDDAVKYAQEANKYAQLSDEYVASQMKIRDTNEAITAAQARLDQAKKANLNVKNPAIYGKAESALAEALAFRTKEQWDPAKASALSVLSILAEIPGVQSLPAQYRVKTWIGTRDCLWNIAAKKEIYGDPWKWTVIYNANKNKLPAPDNPDLVEPGILLDIPSIKGEFRSGIMED